MIFRIPKGKHRARPLRLGLWWGRSVFAWRVMFHPSCRYDIGHPDQLDINKLVGIGYLPHHHRHSARFGWRYDKDRDRIEVMAYCYMGGKRQMQSIAFIEIGKSYRLELYVTDRTYNFYVSDDNIQFFKPLGDAIVPHYHKKKLQYRLGTFFGGNRPAPHDMKIQIERI